MIDEKTIWFGAGLRTPFVGVDGPFAHRDSLALSVPVVQAMAPLAVGQIDFAVWGAVVGNLAYANLAREVWLEASSTRMCRPLRRSCNAALAWLLYSKRPAYWAVVAGRWRLLAAWKV
jgi:hypothetical protein